MVFWHPRGHLVFRQVEGALRRLQQREGYREVRTPQLLRQPIWEQSGHWQNFANDMFLLDEGDGLEAAIKPVSCPAHLQILARSSPSYRDLPLRIAEFGIVHRNERSGSLHGLFRLRQFTQDDGHVFCSLAHVPAEVLAFVQSLRSFYAAFGFSEIEVGFSTRPEHRAGSDEDWDLAEQALREAAEQAGLSLVQQPGQGAFYGPKLEFVLKDRLGRAWQCGTIQLDMGMPARFGVRYSDSDGALKAPVMLHRAVVGSLERFLGILLEQHQGALPPWLAPSQVQLAPISAEQAEGAEQLARELEARGLRVSAARGAETLSRQIVQAHAQGTPFVAILGARELQAGTISLRDREGATHTLPSSEAIALLAQRCAPPL